MELEEKLILLAEDMKKIKTQLKRTLFALIWIILFQFVVLAWIMVR